MTAAVRVPSQGGPDPWAGRHGLWQRVLVRGATKMGVYHAGSSNQTSSRDQRKPAVGCGKDGHKVSADSEVWKGPC